MAYEKPLPRPDADTEPFWQGCRQHLLRFQKCGMCGHVRWPPSLICPVCYSEKAEWITASGKGKVHTFAIFHQAYHEAFVEKIPYVTAIVALQEGPHILTNIVGCEPDQIECDMPVEVTWENITDDFSLPRFKPIP